MGLYDDLATTPAASAAPPKAPGGLYDDMAHATAATPAPAPGLVGFGSGGFGGVTKTLQNAGKTATQNTGRAIVAGHKDPFGAILSGAQAPQRALQAGEIDAARFVTGKGGPYINPANAFMDPKQGPGLAKTVKSGIGLQRLENGPLAGTDLPHKVARGVLDTGLDAVNDPVTYIPGLDLLKIPGVKQLLHAAGSTKAGEALGGLLNPDQYLRGLTPEGKAQYEVITNKSMEKVRAQKDAEDAIVKAHAAQIRAGEMPPEVAALFRAEKGQAQDTAWKSYLTDATGKLKFGPGTKPRDVAHALFASRAPEFKTAAMQDLEKGGFFTSPSGVFASRSMGKHDLFDTATEGLGQPGNPLEEIQSRLRANVEHKLKPEDSNKLVKFVKTMTQRGNQAFLANPIPHTFNLADLAYNKYGAPTVAKGLGNAVKVAAGKTGGKLGANISELEDLGAKSQYGNIFDELGLTRLAGIPGTEGAASAVNKALVPLQRASNYAQHKVLNSTETGLRAAALDAERNAGNTGAAAAKNIHATFGTDAPNGVTEGAANIGMPFAKFHLQTAPGAVLKTLATNPGRIANTLKANADMNAQVNPHGPKYRSSIPGMSSARMLADPLSYLSNLGPLSQINSPFGVKNELLKGPAGISKVLGEVASKYTPGSQEAAALYEALMNKKGRAKESGAQDLINALVGGYSVK